MSKINNETDLTIDDILGDISITVKEVSPKLLKHEKNQRIDKIVQFNPSLMLCLHTRCKSVVHCWNFKTREPNPKKGNLIFHCETWKTVTSKDPQPRQIRNKFVTSAKLTTLQLGLITNGLTALMDLNPIDKQPIEQLIDIISKGNNLFIEHEQTQILTNTPTAHPQPRVIKNCPTCFSNKIITDTKKHENVCKNCGLVIR